MPVKVSNPRKQFQFNIIIPGINPFLCQEVKLPDVEFDVVTHGDTNFDVKTAGKKKIGTLTVNKLFDGVIPDPALKIWMTQIQNSLTGGGLIPAAYKKTIIVEQYSPDGIVVIERYIFQGCWPSKRNGIDFSRKASENTMESIEFQIDEEI